MINIIDDTHAGEVSLPYSKKNRGKPIPTLLEVLETLLSVANGRTVRSVL